MMMEDIFSCKHTTLKEKRQEDAETTAMIQKLIHLVRKKEKFYVFDPKGDLVLGTNFLSDV